MATEFIGQSEAPFPATTTPVELPEHRALRVDSPLDHVNFIEQTKLAEPEQPIDEEKPRRETLAPAGTKSTTAGPAEHIDPVEPGKPAAQEEPKIRRVLDEEGGTTTATVGSRDVVLSLY